MRSRRPPTAPPPTTTSRCRTGWRRSCGGPSPLPLSSARTCPWRIPTRHRRELWAPGASGRLPLEMAGVETGPESLHRCGGTTGEVEPEDVRQHLQESRPRRNRLLALALADASEDEAAEDVGA